VPEEVLEASGVPSPTSQCISGRVAQHVNVDRKWQLCGLASPLDHASNTHPAEWLATFIEEDVIRLDAFLRVGTPQLAQRLKFVPLQVMAAIGTAL
jgi:hypothetical protein